jgi:hypothetical protein
MVKGRVSRVYQNILRSAVPCHEALFSIKQHDSKVGTIIPASTPFGTTSGDNLTRANRKRTLVDELVDDAEAKHYAKKKFNDLQAVRGARGRNTLHAKRAMRRGKW